MMEIFNEKKIAEIKAKSLNGRYLVSGMGSKRKLPHFDDLIILPAQNSRPPIDNYREGCKTKTVIGGRYSKNTLDLDYPIMLGAMSFGAISEGAKIALAKACTKMGISANTGEGGMLPSERENASKLVVQYASGRFGVNADYLCKADAIEIKVGQGAKPGMGGHLMGEKVTEKISKIRGIPVGADALSPARHLDIVGPEDLSLKIQQLREITEWKTPIIVKYAPGRVSSDVKIAVKAGADAVAIDGMQGGTGAAPIIGQDHVGIPTIAAVVEANNALEELGVKDEVDLIISGGIRDGADMAKALALGADAVQISTSALISIGCIMCRQCHTGKCPVGIATQDLVLMQKLSPDATQHFENYLNACISELKILTNLAGLSNVHNLDKEDVRSLDLTTSAITGINLVGH